MTIYATNLETSATTEYSDAFEFNSMTLAHDGKYYGMKADGVYLLEGEYDDGDNIEAIVGLGQSSLDSDKRKNIKATYFDGSSETPLLLRLSYEGESFEYLARSSSTHVQQQRFDVGKGARANMFTLDLYNTCGGDFTLSSLEVIPAVSRTRRIGK